MGRTNYKLSGVLQVGQLQAKSMAFSIQHRFRYPSNGKALAYGLLLYEGSYHSLKILSSYESQLHQKTFYKTMA